MFHETVNYFSVNTNEDFKSCQEILNVWNSGMLIHNRNQMKENLKNETIWSFSLFLL